jgi:hypothetical protein
MKPSTARNSKIDHLDIFDLLFTRGFDATLTLLCTLFVFSVD